MRRGMSSAAHASLPIFFWRVSKSTDLEAESYVGASLGKPLARFISERSNG